MRDPIQTNKSASLVEGQSEYVYEKGQVVHYKGNMFNQHVPVRRVGFGKLYSNTATKTIALTANTPKRIIGYEFAPYNKGITGNTTSMVVQDAGIAMLNGSISFTGGTNIYKLRLRKNGADVCVCNPQLEGLGQAEFELMTTDITPVVEDDVLELFIEADTDKTLSYTTTKLTAVIL